jgi:hypothetical protein
MVDNKSRAAQERFASWFNPAFLLFAFVVLLMISAIGCGASSSATSVNQNDDSLTALAISPLHLPNGKQTSAYSSTISAQGGQSPYSWSISAGNLPPGLSLSSRGVLSGTPSKPGSYSFTVKAEDSSRLRQNATQPYKVQISSVALPGGNLSVSTSSLPGGTQDATYSAALTAAGGKTPYLWAITEGALPSGLTFSSRGEISGAPTAAGYYLFTVQVADAAHNTAIRQLALTIDSQGMSVQAATPAGWGNQLGPGWGRQFVAEDSEEPVTDVNWSVNAIPGGNATVGSVTAYGVYTAPWTPVGVVTITATSQRDANQSASTSVNTVSLSTAGVPPQFQSLQTCSIDRSNPEASICPVLPSPDRPMPALFDGTEETIYRDPTFGTAVKRIGPPAGLSNTSEEWVPNYSTNNIWSPDNKYVLVYLTTGGNWALFDGQTLAYIRTIPVLGGGCPSSGTGFSPSGLDPVFRWMHSDPHSLIYFCQLSILKYNADTGQTSLLAQLPSNLAGIDTSVGGYSAYPRDACNISMDDQRIGMLLVNSAGVEVGMFTYDLTAGYLAGHNFVSTSGPDAQFYMAQLDSKTPGGSCISETGKYVVVQWNCDSSPSDFGSAPNACPNNGTTALHKWYEVYDAETFTFQRQLPCGLNANGSPNCSQNGAGSDIPPHSDTTIDTDGDDVIFSRIDTPTRAYYGGWEAIRLKDGYELPFNLQHAVYGGDGDCGSSCLSDFHISGRAVRLPGWVLISTFVNGADWATWDNPDIGTNPSNGAPLQGEIFTVKIDYNDTKPTLYRLAHDQAYRTGGDYYAEPHATVDDFFTNVMFGSDWRTYNPINPPYPLNFVLPYVVDLTH